MLTGRAKRASFWCGVSRKGSTALKELLVLAA
jgi:hypothetical protein